MPNKQKGHRGTLLGHLLRDLRVRAGHGLKSVAPLLDVDYSYLSKIENGITTPSASFLERVARQYSVSPDELFLAAGKLPPDVAALIAKNPEEVIELVRRRFGHERAAG